MNREQFLALLARLRGEGDALSVEEFGQIAAYLADASRDDATDDEIGEVRTLVRALGADDAVSIDELEAAVAVNDAITAVTTARTEADAAIEERRAALRAQLSDGDEPEEPAEEPAADAPAEEPATEDAPVEEAPATGAPVAEETPAAEPELVGATAAAPAPVRRPATPGQLRNRRPAGAVVETPARRAHNRILRDGNGEFADLSEVGEAMVEARRRFLNANNGVSEQMVLASIEAEYDESRVLHDGQGTANMGKLSAVRDALFNRAADDLDAVVAAGGLCGPAEPYYGLQQLAVSDRPFAAGLQRFSAPRGQVQFRVPPSFPEFDAAVGIWSETNDTLPGSDGPATKPCLVVDCNGLSDAVIYAVTECLTFGNFMARTDPETVANAVANTAAAFARKAEVKLLDGVKALSTAVTAGDALGAWRDLVYQMSVAGVGMRSRLRMRPDSVLEVRMPAWSREMVVNDLRRAMPGDGTLVGAGALFDRALAESNLRVASYYLDSPTGVNQQVFGPQNAGQLVDFPSTVQWHIAVPGSVLMLDNGRLDLGIVRDSILNRTNDFQTFAETFEGLMFVGQAGTSMWVTSTVCPNGAASGLIDPSSFCTGDYVPV